MRKERANGQGVRELTDKVQESRGPRGQRTIEADQGSRDEGRGSKVEGRGSGVDGRGFRAKG